MSIDNVQLLLSGLQQQLSSMSSLAGQLNSFTPEQLVPLLAGTAPPKSHDEISTIVKALVDAELAKRLPPPTPALIEPASSLAAAPEVLALSAPTPQAPVFIPPPAPTSAPTIAMTPQPNMQDLMMKDFLNKIKIAIGGGLTVDQQVWVSSNLFGLPEFLKSDNGREAISNVLNKYKQYVDATSA